MDTITQTVRTGLTAVFTASVVSTIQSPQFQWQANGVSIPGATSPTLTLKNVRAADARTYSVVVSPSVGSQLKSNLAVLNVTPLVGTASASLKPSSAVIAAVGAEGIVQLLVSPQNATWVASSNVNWLTFPVGNSATGDWALTYSVGPNPLAGSRTGQITVSGATFTVTQAGLSVPLLRSEGVLNAASLQPGPIASEQLLSLRGFNLTSATARSSDRPLPAVLGGTSVKVIDRSGQARPAGLYMVEASQIQCVLPPGMSTGPGTIIVTQGGNDLAVLPVGVEQVSPGLFSAGGDGQGVAAATVIVEGSEGSKTLTPAYRCGAASSACTEAPIEFGAESNRVSLQVLATGTRNRTDRSQIIARIAGQPMTVLSDGPVEETPGVDQITVSLPRTLIGAGKVDLTVTVADKTSNAVKVDFGILAKSVPLAGPTGVAVDAAGRLYVAEAFGQVVNQVSSSGLISRVAGTGVVGFSGDGGPATAAALRTPFGLAFDASGNLYITDINNSSIRKVASDGTITRVAGNGTAGFSGDDGPATSAQLSNRAYNVAVDGMGNLYVADALNNRVRRVDSDGIIRTVAGTGDVGFSGDGGPATDARLYTPTGVAVDAQGVLYIAELNSHRVRRVTPDGIIRTVAGSGSIGGSFGAFGGDGGRATAARLNNPFHIAVRGDSLYIADSGNHRVRVVTPDGVIRTVAGNGEAGYSGDGGAAVDASFKSPGAMAFAPDGSLYIIDADNNFVRHLDLSGIIRTVAGK
jgi:uncharacterized protein (TIGR03437 family)